MTPAEGAGGTIVWLASYPKAGNTWLRVLLTNLLRKGDTPVDINDLRDFGHAASRSLFDAYAAVEASDLTPDEIEDLRPAVYAAAAAELRPPAFMKIHDAWSRTPSGEPLVPPEATLGVIYVVRNPLDVAVSLAHHAGMSIDRAIEAMADPANAIGVSSRGMALQLRQRLGTWSGHVSSWMDGSGALLHLVLYEDMVRDPHGTFAGVADFAGVPWAPAALDRAVDFSRFDELQAQERAHGFRQGSRDAVRFFRRGEAGAWRDELTDAQVRRVVADHGETMARLGYLDPRGEPSE